MRRIDGDLRPARHCCHAYPDLNTRGRRTVPTTACLYGPETAGPTRQRGYRRRQERHKTDPLGVGQPLPRAQHAINQTRRGMATVIVRQAATLLP